MTRRNSIIIGALAVFALVVVVAAIRQTVTTTGTVPSSVSYTNAITGQSSVDIVGQTNGLRPGTISASSVTIDGIDVLYNYLSSDQGINAQNIMNDFLMAHSGLQPVSAGIEDGSLVATDNDETLDFTLVVVKPQAKYHVTIKISSVSQTIPDVTFKGMD